MTLALIAALLTVVLADRWVIDRKDKRHDQQLTRLLVHVQAPQTAVAHAISQPVDGPLYLPPEDDQAWNERHKVAD